MDFQYANVTHAEQKAYRGGQYVVTKIYEKSFRKFNLAWSKSEHPHPLSERSQSYISGEIGEIVTTGTADTLLRGIKAKLNHFLSNMVLSQLGRQSHPCLYVKFIEEFTTKYISTVHTWLEAILQPMISEFLGRPQPIYVLHLIRGHIVRKLYALCKFDLRDNCFEVAEMFRRHSYTSGWAFQASVKILKEEVVDALINACSQLEVDMLWNHPYQNLVFGKVEHLILRLPDNITERDFTALACLVSDFEGFLCGRHRIHPDEGAMNNIVFLKFEAEYKEREAQGKFKSPGHLFVSSDDEYNHILVGDLLQMHSYSDEAQESFYSELLRDVRTAIGGWIDNHEHSIQHISARNPLLNTEELLRKLDIYEGKLVSRFEKALRENHVETNFGLPSEDFRKNCFELISNPSVIRRIEETGTYLVNALYRQSNACADFLVDSRDLLGNFFVNIANQKKIMDSIRENATRRIHNGMRPRLDLIQSFLEHDEIKPYTSSSLQRLLDDLRKSESYKRKWRESQMSDSSHEQATIGKCGFVLTKRTGVQEFEDNLLIFPEQIVGLHQSFEECIKRELDSDESIKVVNSESYCTIKTSLFSAESGYTTIRLTVYQLAVLNCLQDGNERRMQDVYNSLIRPNLPSEQKRRQAQRIVNIVVESMMQPHPLIKTTSNRERVSQQDRVILNGGCIHESNIKLPKPDLSNLNTIQEEAQPSAPAPARARNRMKEKVAETITKNIMKRTGTLEEEDLKSQACVKARQYNLEEMYITEAIESMLERNEVVRIGDNNAALKYVPKEN